MLLCISGGVYQNKFGKLHQGLDKCFSNNIILMLYHMPFSTADALAVNNGQKVTAPWCPVRQLRNIVYLRRFLIVQ